MDGTFDDEGEPSITIGSTLRKLKNGS
ncbi:hypothetical protein L195_g046632, partial [Trifolium pratense]